MSFDTPKAKFLPIPATLWESERRWLRRQSLLLLGLLLALAFGGWWVVLPFLDGVAAKLASDVPFKVGGLIIAMGLVNVLRELRGLRVATRDVARARQGDDEATLRLAQRREKGDTWLQVAIAAGLYRSVMERGGPRSEAACGGLARVWLRYSAATSDHQVSSAVKERLRRQWHETTGVPLETSPVEAWWAAAHGQGHPEVRAWGAKQDGN